MASEAHEKTRIRQLEDAATHWEHKYTNARQYNRNLEERNKQLEAALREIIDGQTSGCKHQGTKTRDPYGTYWCDICKGVLTDEYAENRGVKHE
jgi:hypothetical protein